MDQVIHLVYRVHQFSPAQRDLGTLDILAIPGRRMQLNLTNSDIATSAAQNSSDSTAAILFMDGNCCISIIGKPDLTKKGLGTCNINSFDQLRPSPTIPYLPGKWFPFATELQTSSGISAMVPINWILQQTRWEGSIQTPSKVLQGCFPNLPDAKATVDYTYSNWIMVNKIPVPQEITFKGVYLTSIGLRWTLVSSSVAPTSALPPHFVARCNAIYDDRLTKAGDVALGSNGSPSPGHALDLTLIAARNTRVLASLVQRNKAAGRATLVKWTFILSCALLIFAAAFIVTRKLWRKR